MKRHDLAPSALTSITVTGASLFGIVFLGLFLMVLGGSCAEITVAYALESEDLAEQLVSIPLAAAAALVAAFLAAAAFSIVATTIAAGYRVLVGAAPASGARGAGTSLLAGLGTMLLAGALGGWRMSAGYAGGEPAWVMQGTVVAAVGVIVGFMVVVGHVPLWMRRGRSGVSPPSRRKKDASPAKDDASVPPELAFTFCAVLGLVASFGVVKYVHLARAQAGDGPLVLGEFSDGWVRSDGFQGYPKKASLELPERLDGSYAIVYIEVDPCTMQLVDDRDEPVKVKRVAKKTDEDGDTTAYARLVLEAKRKRRYRLLLTSKDDSCIYSVRLIRHLEDNP